jgi:hypothetical protein
MGSPKMRKGLPSLNPKGRPPVKLHMQSEEVQALARSYGREAIDTLAGLMRSSESEAIRGAAARDLLDRGWGKPKQSVEVEAGPSQRLLELIDAARLRIAPPMATDTPKSGINAAEAPEGHRQPNRFIILEHED